MGSILKEVRVRGYGQNLDIKVTIEKSGLFNKKRKLYATFWGKNTSEYEKDKSIYDWGEMEFVLEDLTEDNNFGEYRTYYESYIAARDKPNPFKISNFYQVNNLEFSKEWNTDLDIIKLYILINTEKIKPKIASWALIEDPIKGEKGGVAPYYRSFGNDAYHLNNGAQIYISWTDAQSNLSKGGDSWSDEKGRELKEQDLTKYNTKYLTKDSKGNIDKMVSRVVAPDGNSAGDGILTYDPRSFPVFSKEFKSSQKVYGMVDDINIVNQVISHWKQAVPGYDTLELLKNSNGVPIINMSDLSTVLIEYKSPLGMSASEPTGTTASENSNTGLSASNATASTPTTFLPTIKGIEDGFQINAKTDLPNFSIYVGDPDKDWPKVGAGDIPEDGEDFENVDGAEELDEEYVENEFIGDEEAPPNIPEVSSEFNNVSDNGSSSVNNTSYSSYGNGVLLPTGPNAYSHNSTQGYNLVDSKWYGDLLTSARAHIDHPTFDIPGTERGNLGCASWVSMVFYRAFGVNMKDGKSVPAVPKSIGKFGSTGTGELGGWFGANPTMWEKIPWKEGQPGDVINTERGSQSGHVGIVMDEKHADGTWKVASNSSKGFGSSKDPAGCGKLNYSIKSWQSVTNRNPNRTFCWRYKGPRLPQGQT